MQQRVDGGGWAAVGDYTGSSVQLNPGSSGSYGYRVAACNATGCSAWSAIKTVSVVRPPGIPTILSATQHNYYAGPQNSEYSRCDVSWTAVAHATRYELHADGGILLYNGSLTSVSGERYSIQYCAARYIVRACNAAGCSAFSASFTHTLTQDPYPGNGGGVEP